VSGQSQEEQKRMKTCYTLKNKGTKSLFFHSNAIEQGYNPPPGGSMSFKV